MIFFTTFLQSGAFCYVATVSRAKSNGGIKLCELKRGI